MFLLIKPTLNKVYFTLLLLYFTPYGILKWGPDASVTRIQYREQNIRNVN